MRFLYASSPFPLSRHAPVPHPCLLTLQILYKRQPLVRCATSLEITDLGSLATNPASNHDFPPPPLSPTACGRVNYMFINFSFFLHEFLPTSLGSYTRA